MANTPSDLLSPKSSNIGLLFKSSFFVVPSNQRDYRWKSDQRETLWEDLLMAVAYDCKPGNDHPMGHFLGQIVLIGPEQSMDSMRLEVIDGQQRLTSISILAECLRPFAESISDPRQKMRVTHVLTDCILALDSDYAPRMKLNREHDFYYNSLALHATFEKKQSYWSENWNRNSEVQNNIKNAFVEYQAKIREYLEAFPTAEDQDKNLIDLIDVLTKNLYFLVVRAENSMMVYRLFETLNERGLDLSQADLIKNVLLESARVAGHDQVDTVALFWQKFVDNYEQQPNTKLDLPHLIQFSYTYRHALVKKEDIFDRISNDLRSGRVDSLELASELEEDSQNWSKFLSGDLQNWKDTQADSQYAICDPLWKKHCAPFIIAIMDKYSDNYGMLERLSTVCEHYLFREGLVCKQSVLNLQKVFGEAAFLVRTGADVDALAEHFSSNSSDEYFVECFKTASLNSMKQRFYAIWKIENFLLNLRGLELKPRSQSAAQHLEHIMPRSPSEEWEINVEDDDFQIYNNRLGNLLILTAEINQHIRNKSIDFKIENESNKDYIHSEMKLASELGDKRAQWLVDGKWTYASIAERQEYLATTYAKQVWYL